jgi:hypothetical protein
VLLAPPTGSVSGNTMDWDFRTEYAKNYSVSVQRQLTSSTVAEISFLRSAIVGADSSTVRNVPVPGPGPISARRPIPELSSITAIRWDGYSIFNAATWRIEQRLARGLSLAAHYTLSKAVDDASDPGPTSNETNLPQDVRNMAAEKALASFDHRHRFVTNVSYELPRVGGERSWAGTLGSGWQATAIVLLQSGAPFTVNMATDVANIGSGPAQRPNLTCDPKGGGETAERWFNTACFSVPAPFSFGNAGRNTVRAPGYATVDTALQKTITLGRDVRLQLRWEIFNLLNRANFDLPSRIAFTPNFGRIFSAGPARQMQFGARLSF